MILVLIASIDQFLEKISTWSKADNCRFKAGETDSGKPTCQLRSTRMAALAWARHISSGQNGCQTGNKMTYITEHGNLNKIATG
jgi:hypothetical protein